MPGIPAFLYGTGTSITSAPVDDLALIGCPDERDPAAVLKVQLPLPPTVTDVCPVVVVSGVPVAVAPG